MTARLRVASGRFAYGCSHAGAVFLHESLIAGHDGRRGATNLHDGQIPAYPVGQITAKTPAVSCPQEGRFAVVTDVGRGMRWTRMVQLTRAPDADGEVAWS